MTDEDRRLELQSILATMRGVSRAYFKPPSDDVMVYPCIRYSYTGDEHIRADDRRYIYRREYTLIFITPDPTSDVPTRLLDTFDHITFDRSYTAKNLNHYVFTLYY